MMGRLERQRIRRKVRREHGLCHDCLAPAFPGKSRCSKHLLDNYRNTVAYSRRKPWIRAENEKIRRQRLKINGKCIRCAVVLDADMDGGHFKCLNCREELDAI